MLSTAFFTVSVLARPGTPTHQQVTFSQQRHSGALKAVLSDHDAFHFIQDPLHQFATCCVGAHDDPAFQNGGMPTADAAFSIGTAEADAYERPLIFVRVSMAVTMPTTSPSAVIGSPRNCLGSPLHQAESSWTASARPPVT